MIEFFLNMVPPTATHHHKKIVRAGGFSRLADKPELQQARSTYESLLEKFQPKEPMSGPVRLELCFHWPFLKSAPSRDRVCERKHKVTKPDCSNIAKTLEDCLARMRFINNDAEVAELEVKKFHSHIAGINIRIIRL